MTLLLSPRSATVTIRSERLGASLFNRPPHVFESCVNDGARQSKDVFPVADWSRFSPECYLDGVAPVQSLLSACRPSAIVWSIALVVLSSIKAVLAGWSWTHVGNEVVERRPPLTYSYSTSTVVLPCVMSWSATPCQHVGPNSIFLGPGLMVSDCRLTPEISVLLAQTPTTLSITAREITASDDRDTATEASTLALPCTTATVCLVADTENRETTKHTSFQVLNWLTTACCYIGLSHAVSSLLGDVLVRGRWSLPTIFGSDYFTSQFLVVST